MLRGFFSRFKPRPKQAGMDRTLRSYLSPSEQAEMDALYEALLLGESTPDSDADRIEELYQTALARQADEQKAEGLA